MNDLPSMQQVQNRYFIMRHGQSEANVAGIINSHPDARMKYGLTATGQKQVVTSAEKARQQEWLDADTIIYSSDFRRAQETTKLVSEVLRNDNIHLTPELRERYFGKFDGKSTANCAKVWLHDIQRRTRRAADVETVFEILDRTSALILELERTYSDKTILLVSHGDTLHILQTALQHTRPTRHRLLKYIQVAEIRRLP